MTQFNSQVVSGGVNLISDSLRQSEHKQNNPVHITRCQRDETQPSSWSFWAVL